MFWCLNFCFRSDRCSNFKSTHANREIYVGLDWVVQSLILNAQNKSLIFQFVKSSHLISASYMWKCVIIRWLSLILLIIFSSPQIHINAYAHGELQNLSPIRVHYVRAYVFVYIFCDEKTMRMWVMNTELKSMWKYIWVRFHTLLLA